MIPEHIFCPIIHFENVQQEIDEREIVIFEEGDEEDE